MAPNPNPARISAPLWWFVEQSLALFPGSRNGGTFTDKPGSHNTRDGLIADGLTNDYSIRDPLNRQGPGDKGAAFDQTFPDAQAGDYRAIVVAMHRIHVAFSARDERTYGLFEVLGQADYDTLAEGFVFYPTRRIRTPDASHLWHIHYGWIRAYLNDWRAFAAVMSILAGESPDTWRAGRSRYWQEEINVSDQKAIHNAYLYARGAVGLHPEIWVYDEDQIVSPAGSEPRPNPLAAALTDLQDKVTALVERPAAGAVTLSAEDRAAIVAELKAELGELLGRTRLAVDAPEAG